SMTASARNFSPRARSPSGTAATSARPNATAMSQGSKRKPSRQSRHSDESAGGSSTSVSPRPDVRSEDIEHPLLLALLGLAGGEALGLQVEHRPVAPAQ